MDNRGKLWQIDDDQKLMETPYVPDAVFAQNMGRTVNAIKCRRSHLAAKMHQNDPQIPLEECVALMNADFAQASTLLVEWNEKRDMMKNFFDNNRKRKSRETQIPPSDSPPVRSPFFQQSRASAGGPPRADDTDYASCHWPTATRDEKIGAICKSISDEGGNLSSLFNDPQFLPCLVQHYPGFEAYARIVQARGSNPLQR